MVEFGAQVRFPHSFAAYLRQTMRINEDKRVSIVALPSPGSSFRKLAQFDYVKDLHMTSDYLRTYLQVVFNWFKN